MASSANVIDRRPRRRRSALRRVLGEPFGAIGLVLVVAVLLIAIFAPWIAQHSPIKLSPVNRFLAPSEQHLLGTDHLGRDLFARVVYGSRIALSVSLGATLLSLLLGVTTGLIAGYGPRWLDNALLLAFDALKSFPTVMLALALVTLVGPSLNAVILVVIISAAPSYARMARTQTLSVRHAEFVLAERSLGAGAGRIIATHILPNIIGPILIVASMDIPVVVAIEAGMSFLGLGVRPPTPSWGSILNDGFSYIRESPWPVIAGGLPIVITTLGFTFLGEALRDTFDPKRAGETLMTTPALAVEHLDLTYRTDAGPLRALRDVSLEVAPGEIVGIVGESGCGKSSLIQAILRLMPVNAVIERGRIALAGTDLLALDPESMRRLRGDRISVVFQDPMTALNPVLSIGRQMMDIQYRRGGGKAAKRARAIEMLRRVRLPDPEHRLGQYPHEFSGGMRQRIAIAMALVAEPELLIADEPTTALDATLELATIELLKTLQREIGCAILFVSHHLGVIAELCDRVNVMYAGEVVETGDIRSVFHQPRHPYTERLLACDPARMAERSRRLPTIPGELPDLVNLPAGCVFADRCPAVFEPCRRSPPDFYRLAADRAARCYLSRDGANP